MAEAARVIPLKQPKASFGAILATTATAAKPAAKKSSIPTLQATEEVKTAVDTYQENKITFEQSKAAMAASGEIITDFVREAQDEAGFAGRYQGSYAVMGHKHTAKVVYANKFSINGEDRGELAQLLGENFANLIAEKYSVKLRAEVFTDEALQAELVELMGERFNDFLETTVSLSVREDFSRLIYQAIEPEELDSLRLYAKQNKPSIR